MTGSVAQALGCGKQVEVIELDDRRFEEDQPMGQGDVMREILYFKSKMKIQFFGRLKATYMGSL
jgi:hypothetical protein